MNSQLYDVLILGGGPAGLTAAIYTARSRLKTLVVAGNPPGGQLTTTTEVENFPGFPEGILGPNLINLFRKQAEKFSTDFIDENVSGISGDEDSGFEVATEGGKSAKGRCVIIATGASAKWLRIPGEQRLIGKGVSACATCDGFFFKGKIIAIVGGGDSAMEEATFLTKFAAKVYVLVRKEESMLRASTAMQERAKANPKIEFMYNAEAVEVLGENSVEGIKIKNNKTGEESVLSDVSGFFVAIGHKPNTDFLKGFIELDSKGYIDVTDQTKTSKKGVFVAGDVADYKYRQAITAAGYGCMASIDVEKFICEKEACEREY